jgi:hypothetical protein
MVAVVILIGVIVASSKIFGIASRVTGIGQAGAAVLQEAAAIERQLRADFERLSTEGFFGIRCVALRNDVNVQSGGGLLNPSLPPDAVIRADQLVFFTQGLHSIQTLRGGTGTVRKGQGPASRIYYGHAFQLPGGLSVAPEDDYVRAHDAVLDPVKPLVPWYRGAHDAVKTVFRADRGIPEDYKTLDAGAVDATQPVAKRWLLARQAVILAGDSGAGGDREHVYLPTGDQTSLEGGYRSGRSIFTVDPDPQDNFDPVSEVRNGRVDLVASQLNDVRRFVTLAPVGGNTVLRPWFDPVFGDNNGFRDQRSAIGDALYYPRAERAAPGTHRVDQALTNHVLAGACSSFIVDWTYENGTGEVRDMVGKIINLPGPDGILGTNDDFPLWGVLTIAGQEQPWLGLDDSDRGVVTLEQHVQYIASFGNPNIPLPIFPWNIEQYEPSATGRLSPAGHRILKSGAITVYEAFFGYNRETPLDPDGNPITTLGYTPWPSAIRITMVLHDNETKLEHGREVQFVIDLPQRR